MLPSPAPFPRPTTRATLRTTCKEESDGFRMQRCVSEWLRSFLPFSAPTSPVFGSKIHGLGFGFRAVNNSVSGPGETAAKKYRFFKKNHLQRQLISSIDRALYAKNSPRYRHFSLLHGLLSPPSLCFEYVALDTGETEICLQGRLLQGDLGRRCRKILSEENRAAVCQS